MFYLYHSLRVVNKVPEFKLRIENGDVYEYEQISGSITVMRTNQTFGFIYFDYETDFDVFSSKVKQLINNEKSNTGLRLEFGLTNVIHYSVLPGINFTSLQHAQTLNGDSVPKMVFGKYQFINGQVFLPLAVHVHHGLCDGLHVETFINLFQSSMELDH